jgi:hypothetical protein
MRTSLFILGAAFIALADASAAGKIFTVSYPASERPGELRLAADYTLWVPEGVKQVRAVLVHQHGCGFAANAAGETAAFDLHWQALAAKWDAALLAPRYHQTADGREGCELWMDPRLGSRQTFLKALDKFAEQSGHAELKTAPWCLWGHSGGGYWASLMQTLDPERIVAVWLRSGTAFAWWESGEIERPVLSDAVYHIPMLLNPGTKESTSDNPKAAWQGSAAMFKAYRAKGAPIGFAADPLSGHDCGGSRYLAIPFFDSCLAMRLPDSAGKLRELNVKQGWFAELMGREAVPLADFKGKANAAVWLPDERTARAWMEYVRDGVTSDASPPPAPTKVTVARKDARSMEIAWEATADFESGLRAFVIERDGKKLAQVPEEPVGKFSQPLFQAMSFHDTPEMPLPEMRYLDTTVTEGAAHEYRVIAINGVGLSSAPASPISP